jgi:hypothetical protein
MEPSIRGRYPRGTRLSPIAPTPQIPQKCKDPASPEEESGIPLVVELTACRQPVLVVVTIELLIGLISGIAWMPELAESYPWSVNVTVYAP